MVDMKTFRFNSMGRKWEEPLVRRWAPRYVSRAPGGLFRKLTIQAVELSYRTGECYWTSTAASGAVILPVEADGARGLLFWVGVPEEVPPLRQWAWLPGDWTKDESFEKVVLPIEASHAPLSEQDIIKAWDEMARHEELFRRFLREKLLEGRL